MLDLLKTAGGKLLFAVVGVAITLAWWSWSGNDHGDYEYEKRLPVQVMGGGGGTIKLKFEINQPAELSASFSTYDEDTDEESGVEVLQEFDPGLHIKSVEVSEDANLYFELKIPDATPGAEIDWNVYYDDRPVYDEEMKLDEPLRGNYAFFTQFEVDSVADIRDWLDSR